MQTSIGNLVTRTNTVKMFTYPAPTSYKFSSYKKHPICQSGHYFNNTLCTLLVPSSCVMHDKTIHSAMQAPLYHLENHRLFNDHFHSDLK